MKKPWENLAFTWWPSWVGTDPGFPAVPAQPVEEAWRRPGPTMGAPASATPPRPISPSPTEGGLLSSLGPGTGDGLLGRLAPPVENLDSGRYGGDTLAPPITGVSLISAGDNYRPVPGATGGHPFPAPPNRSPLNASVSIPEQTSVVMKPQACPKFYPTSHRTTIGFRAQITRPMGTTITREEFIESSRFRRKLGKYLIRRRPGRFHFISGMSMMSSIACTMMRLKNS